MTIMEYVQKLKSRGLAPDKIEVAQWHSWTLVSCYAGASSKFISESVAMGVDKDPQIALAKALSEFLERKLSKESPDEVVRFTARSDGFAAYPVYEDQESSKMRARANAMGEAIERFAWASWWDDIDVAYNKTEIEIQEMGLLQPEFQLKSLSSLSVPTGSQQALKILLAENKSGGFITGGAAGMVDQESETFSRAFGELLRHLLVVNKMKSSDRSELSFYEKRLWGFASGDWRDLVLARLEKTSDRILSLPKLIVDQPISHPHSDILSIHRCLFENQPIFIGGPLERLCI